MRRHMEMVVLVALPLSCGGQEIATPTDAGGRDDAGVAGNDSGADGTVVVRDAGSPLTCPSTEPPEGGSCTPPMTCEFGSDPHCTTLASCVSKTQNGPFYWELDPSDPSCVSSSPLCPATFGAPPNGSACPGQVSCTYTQGRCACVPCESEAGFGSEWLCGTWTVPAGCPEPRPLIGTACSDDGQECDYGPVCCDPLNVGPALVCTGGVWGRVPIGCDCVPSQCLNP